MSSLFEALSLAPRHYSQIDPDFIRGMAARMAMSFEKYGDLRDAYPHKVDALASMKLRLDKYAETGNTEYLMDAANFLMIEYMAPRHIEAHFKAEDAAASPGRVNSAGVVSQEANTSSGENIRLGGSKFSTAGGFYKHEGA